MRQMYEMQRKLEDDIGNLKKSFEHRFEKFEQANTVDVEKANPELSYGNSSQSSPVNPNVISVGALSGQESPSWNQSVNPSNLDNQV